MQESLGINITNKMIKYAKVKKDNKLKIETYGVKFYNNNIASVISEIIKETNSKNSMISLNLNGTEFYQFETPNMAQKSNLERAIKAEFDSFCVGKYLNKDQIESRYAYTKSLSNPSKLKVQVAYNNKEEVDDRIQSFEDLKLVSIVPEMIALPNIAYLPKNKNVMIINLEDRATITTIINQQIYSFDILNVGFEKSFNKIINTENDVRKAYEICKNTTIYTMDAQDSEESEYLNYIVADLKNVVANVQEIVNKYDQIDNIYITGFGTVVNNVDLFFQEFFPNSKVEILRPFFLTEAEKVNIKDYIEVNSAIALAVQGLGYGEQSFNFASGATWKNIKQVLTSDVKDLGKNKKSTSVSGLSKYEAAMIRNSILLIIFMIMFGLVSLYLNSNINKKLIEAEDVLKYTKEEIEYVQEDDDKIVDKTKDYLRYTYNLENASDELQTKQSRKNQITTLLNNIVYNIPKDVQLTEIKNVEKASNGKIVEHIIIKAQAIKIEQLAIFKKQLESAGVLENLVSDTGVTNGDYVQVTYEGDLK